MGHEALWQAFVRARKALEAGGFEYVEWTYRWKPRQAGGKFRLQPRPPRVLEAEA